VMCFGEGVTTRLLDSLGVTLVLQLVNGRSSVLERTTMDAHHASVYNSDVLLIVSLSGME
jgi:hypothetical protein